jgi:AcrR family transcriptional regulator
LGTVYAINDFQVNNYCVEKPMSTADAPTKTVRRRKDARPSEILDAAATVFAQYGFAAANLERVADLAQVSKGTIYRYFEDKDVLFTKVIEAKLFDQLQEPPPFPRLPDTTIETALRQALLLAYEMGKRSHLPNLVRVLVLEGERFGALRKSCFARLIALANGAIRGLLVAYDIDGRLTSSRIYANPSVLFFPVICAIAMAGEMEPIEDFDMNALVHTHIDLVCADLGKG